MNNIFLLYMYVNVFALQVDQIYICKDLLDVYVHAVKVILEIFLKYSIANKMEKQGTSRH